MVLWNLECFEILWEAPSEKLFVVEPPGMKLNLRQQNCGVRLEGWSWAAATEHAATLGQPDLMYLTCML